MNRFYRFFSSSIASADNTSSSNSKPFIFKYLIDKCNFSETQAHSTSTRLSHIKHPQKPDSVLDLLLHMGFSHTHIQNAIHSTPQILVADPQKTLKPKLALLQQQLGLYESDLGQFVSNNSTFLTMSLERKLLPCIQTLKKILPDSTQVIQVLQRCRWIVYKDPASRLLPNISLLQSCGIVESQLSMLLKRQPMLFAMKSDRLQGLVERVKEMGFSTDSRMFVYALYTVSCMSPERLERKLELLGSFGLSREESMEMFRRAPSLMRTSEKKLELGMQCFQSVLGDDRTALIRCPACLMYSIEKRVLPRWRAVGILRSKMLLKKDPSFVNVIQISEAEFLQKYILKFGDVADELLLAYKGHVFKSYVV
ncbi:hypothetical protein MRB53_034092 [Persea americana]|uniref:Uncharacterized protein n=1 Tax=Persea americana TaxID=3435 RepID=A0ACC2KXK9_PERAE|nr:hypothetical protein MRB53_034092 [Persea americana]|eukprot:TRINITY_DN32936_c1_g1_i1.p1 TRINITY_DN32936_c1_g1~~TRINITY_DN32936_c1_g1_i1.p1  ORF type:complete len:367 (-),score=63.42 TRINITY_DN32936_c1_g1_i1:35-1135(-)